MKKIISVFFLCFVVSTLQANELFRINLTENQKLESTFSASLADKSTLHIMVVKNKETKKYELIPVYVNPEKQAKKLVKMVYEDVPTIVSYHLNGNIASLITHNEKKEELLITDFNLTNGSHHLKKLKNEKLPDNVFRVDDETTLIYTNEESVNSTLIKNADNISFKVVEVPDEYQKSFKKFLKNEPQAINQNEYVKNGSISDARAYLDNDQIVFTENTNSFEANIFQFDFEQQTAAVSEFNFRDADTKYRGFNTYLQNDDLFVVLNSKEDVLFKTQNIIDKTKKSEISIKNSLSKITKEKGFLENFLKNANKSSMKPTVTLNKNNTDNFVVRIDYVNKNSYVYYYDWWFHHHWMFHNNNMMIQQQIQIQTQNMSFGPNPEYYNRLPLVYKVETKKEESYAIEFEYNLSANTIIENGNLETSFKHIDRDSHLDEFEKNKKMKEFTADFTDTDVRYIYQDKKTKTIYIKYKNL